ncbi:MAG: hypothetical protein ACLGIW_13590, partial [Gammaproteobacteria bacterium]
AWRPRVALIQNELLPRDWEKYRYEHPTVISVWFEKKQGTDAKPATQRVERQQRCVGCPVGVGDAQVAKLHAQRQTPFDVEFADGHRAPVQALAQLALD